MRLAFVGLGAMGSLMAGRVAKAPDVELALFDVERDRLARLANLGRAATSVADAAKDADAVFSVVPADIHVRSVVEQLERVAHPGQVYVDFSTIGPDTIEEVSRRLARRGVQTISAGMTQSLEGAANGTLRLYVGGASALPTLLEPTFSALASEVRMVGEGRSAKALKLINNMIVACLDVAICEALVLGQRLGLDRGTVTAALSREGADSWPLHHHIIAHVLPDDLGPGFFSTRFLIKDMTLCMAFLAGHGLPGLFAGIATSFYRGTVALGHGDDYHMVVIRWLEHISSLDSGAVAQVSGPGGDAQVLRALSGMVSSIQALVSAEALRALGHIGLSKVDGARHLQAGSAGNDSLRSVIAGHERSRGGEADQATLRPAELVRHLGTAIELARDANVPATMAEVARHVALGLGERYGAQRNLWSTTVQS